MATIYFTNNADSGDGSLRATVANAVDGDVVSPDPSVDWGSNVVTISLSSVISIAKSIEITGGTNRVRLDGQGSTRCLSLSNSTVALTNVDVVRGLSTGSQAGGVYATNSTVTLRRCRILGNRSQYYGSGIYIISGSVLNMYDCVVAGNNSVAVQSNSSALTCAANTTANISRCTFSGNVQRDVRAISGATVTITDTLAQRALADTEAPFTEHTPSTAGFVAAPPDVVSNSDWTNALWQGWDLRLTPASTFLSGSTGANTENDIYGHSRLANGSIGAYEGSWIVCTDSMTIASTTTCDYLESSGTLNLSAGISINVLKSAQIADSSSVVGASGAWSFITVPSGTTTSASCVRANVVQRSAGILTAEATTSQVSWTASNITVPIVIQGPSTATTWETLGTPSGGTYSGTFTAGTTLRLFDGVDFTSVTVVESSAPITFHPWGVYDAYLRVDTSPKYSVTTGYIMMSVYYNRGETPLLFARVQNSQTEAIIAPSEVSSISYTAYKKTTSWSNEKRTAVDGHSNISVPTSALLSALVTNDPRWKVDTTGYNFLFEPDSRTKPIFPTPGEYVVVVTLSFSGGNPLPIEYEITVN